MTKKIIADKVLIADNGLLIPKNVNLKLWNRAMEDIAKNNTWCPDITRIIYNLGKKVDIKTKKTYDVLTCSVFFNDNSKVVVMNSINDPIELVKADNGVLTASEASKERALTYAICKRLIGKPNDKGEVEGNGFGRILRELVASAWDQKVEEKRASEQKAVAKAKFEAEQKNAKPKVKRESLAKTVDRLSSVITKLEKDLAEEKAKNARKSWCQKPSKKSSRKRDAYGKFV